MENKKQYNKVLTIAGSDSGGGAGIQADIKTISALGCYAASAITAITVQNTCGVFGVSPVPVDIIKGQIDVVLSDIGADAVKIGMLHSSQVIEAVREMLDKYEQKNIVLDPVMVSTSGHRLIEEEAVDSLKKILLPRADIITPNIPEAEILLGRKIGSQGQLPDVARRLAELYGVSVLLKAGHLVDDTLIDVFYDVQQGTFTELRSMRVNTKNTHGTGCTLSSALASHLALGFNPCLAAVKAKDYINSAIISGSEYEIGNGHGPVNHFCVFS